jgi:hypothetical protein
MQPGVKISWLFSYDAVTWACLNHVLAFDFGLHTSTPLQISSFCHQLTHAKEYRYNLCVKIFDRPETILSYETISQENNMNS